VGFISIESDFIAGVPASVDDTGIVASRGALTWRGRFCSLPRLPMASDSNMATGPTALAPSRAAMMQIVWRLAWPVILTMSVESLVGLVDMLMVGRLGARPVAGVGVATQILFAVNTVMFAVGTGTIAVVARHYGAREPEQCGRILGQSILLVTVLMTLVAIPVFVWAPAIISLFRVEAEVVAIGVDYLRVVLLAVPADGILVIIGFALRGAGDMRTPLAVGVVVAVVNVVANYVLIFGKLGFPALGATGAAWGTALAFATGAVLLFWAVRRGGLTLTLPPGWMRPQPAVIRRIVAIGYPSAIEHILMQVGFVIYFSFAAAYDTAAVAAYVIGVRILGLSFLPGIGFSVAASALVGQNLGARKPEQARRSGWGATGLSVVLMSIGGLLIFLGARPIAALFVDDARVVAEAVVFIQVLAAAQPLMALDFTLGGALRGAGDTRFPLLTVLIGFYVCRLGFAYCVTYVFELSLFWLWFALVPDYVARVVLKVARFRSNRWQEIRV